MLNVIISLIAEPSPKLSENTGVWDIFLPLAVYVPVNILGFAPVGDQGNNVGRRENNERH